MYLEEESADESEEEDNELEREGGREGDIGEGKSSGHDDKRKLRTGRSGSMTGRRRTHKAAAAAGGRGKTNNKCRVV